MGTREVPKEYLNIGGVSTTLIGNPGLAREYIPIMRKMIFQLHSRNTLGLAQDWLTQQLPNGGHVHVTTRFGSDSAYIYMPPVPGGQPEKKLREEVTVIVEPVPCIDLENYPLFDGFYVCSTLAWSPFRRITPDLERPHNTWNYDSINADGDPNQEPIAQFIISIEETVDIFPLVAIGTPDLHDDDGDYTTDITGGYFDPGLVDRPDCLGGALLDGTPCAKNLGTNWTCIAPVGSSCITGI